MRLPFSPEISLPKTTWLSSPVSLIFSVSLNEDKTERPPFLHSSRDGSRLAGGDEYSQWTRLARCIHKMTEKLRTIHTCEREIFWGLWWPVSPKLVLNQTAAPVSQIMDGYYIRKFCVADCHKDLRTPSVSTDMWGQRLPVSWSCIGFRRPWFTC